MKVSVDVLRLKVVDMEVIISLYMMMLELKLSSNEFLLNQL